MGYVLALDIQLYNTVYMDNNIPFPVSLNGIPYAMGM